jgi:DNA helicase-2/ATP-dependent DNA helicase PcrA
VEIIGLDSFDAVAQALGEKIKVLQGEAYKSFAVICKNNEEATLLHGHLKAGGVQAVLIGGKEEEYSSGVIVVPSYLAKGLEFDVTIIANANQENYREEELDIKLLYVAMTRPLHQLIIYYHGELTSLLR